MTTANDLSVRRALENAGVEFIDDSGAVWVYDFERRGEKGRGIKVGFQI